MRYVSVFSGIEAASVAWEPLGWEPMAFCEIDEFPSAVLRARYPNVPNLGDITKVDWLAFKETHGTVDLVVGGSPCQSFSIAGKREGLAGESGLMFEYIRCVQDLMPEWFIWENVPGALSSERGKAFAQLLSEMDELGYGLAWRILDAQFFGVAQRRRRVFLVGHLGDMRACEVLFEPEGLRWDTPSSKEKRKALAADAGGGTKGSDRRMTSFAQNTRDEVRIQGDGTISGALSAQPGMKQTTYVAQRMAATQYGEEVAGTLTARHDSSPCADRGQNVVLVQNSNGEDMVGALCARGYKGVGSEYVGEGKVLAMASGQANAEVSEEVASTLSCLHEAPIVAGPAPVMLKMRHTGTPNARGGEGAMWGEDVSYTLSTSQDQTMFQPDGDGWVVRRFMPVECERLQGFPDGWTDIGEWTDTKGKKRNTGDGNRYKALGNSFAVPVVRWIGERIKLVMNAD